MISTQAISARFFLFCRDTLSLGTVLESSLHLQRLTFCATRRLYEHQDDPTLDFYNDYLFYQPVLRPQASGSDVSEALTGNKQRTHSHSRLVGSSERFIHRLHKPALEPNR